MFWVAIATLIMAVTGKGDDTRFFLDYIKELRAGIQEEIPDEERQEQALTAVDDTLTRFKVYRTQMHTVGECLEAADRDYAATRQDYEACLKNTGKYWDRAVEDLLDGRSRLHEVVTEEERGRINARLRGKK